MSEWEFLAAVAEGADCGILLDVNNIYVSARNLGFDPVRYIEGIPPARVGQFHLAGFTDMGTYLFDTHSAPVHEDVWELYRLAVRRFGDAGDAGRVGRRHSSARNGLRAEAERARARGRAPRRERIKPT